MEFRILNKSFDDIDVLDNMLSAIWTDRYYNCGDFQFDTRVSPKVIQLMDPNEEYYLSFSGSDHIMIIEDISLDTDKQYGNTVTVTGRSLEYILARRIVWDQTTLSGNLVNCIRKLLNENIINPTNPDRKIPNFIFKTSTLDTKIWNLSFPGEAQYQGQDLYSVISSICEAFDIGFKITVNEYKQLVFTLYTGLDKSFDQNENDYVLFSPKMDNLLSSNYYQSTATYKNVVLVAGEGEGTSRKMVSTGTASGLNRREMFADARDISSNNSAVEASEYDKLLIQRGNETLLQNDIASMFEGGVEMSKQYKFNQDIFMGDIVQLVNEYGMEARVRIIEVVNSQKGDSIERFPTFKYL